VDRILVIDDSKETRDFLEDFLGSHGFAVSGAGDGEQGLLRALNENPDVVLVDMQMPGMTGLDLIRALEREGREIPVILVTAYGSEEVAVRAFRAGARDYVPKPYEPQSILSSVDRALREVRLRRERDRLTKQLTQANETLQRQVEELNALYAIGRAVTSLLDLEQVLDRVVDAATFITQAEEGSLMLLDESSGELYLRSEKNFDEHLARGLRLRADDSLAGRVVSTGRPILLASEELKKITTAYLVKAMLMVPLRTAGSGVIGALMVANKVSDRAFGERDLHVLTALASYAAVAIDNASLVADLQNEKNKVETILSEVAEVVLVVDEGKRILLCNRSARRAFHLDADGAAGRRVDEVISDQDFVMLLDRPLDADHFINEEITLSDGRTLSASVSRVNGVGYAIVMHDITHLKEIDRIRSEFVTAVSHDLRTPLTTIQGYIDLLPRAGPLTEQQQDYLVRMQRSLSAVGDLVSDLLDMSRIETGSELEMVPTKLDTIITDAVAELHLQARTKEQRLDVQMPDCLSEITGNPRRLRQVIDNLVGNAIKYTPPRGHITVQAEEGADHIRISVIDDGFGIPVDDQPYVFDKFFRVDLPETREIPGTGLGLAIVQSVVEKHGGRVWVQSERGKGSVFTLLLPKK
jgi:signal transduction histidine kinase/DNA-binding response OmpR family regulator